MAESAQDVQRIAVGVIQARLMDGRQLMDEFRSVLGRDPSIRHSHTAAQANPSKNRYVNVLPYDHNRVLLRPCTCGSGSTPATATAEVATGNGSSAKVAAAAVSRAAAAAHASDYINASYVVHEDAQCGFSVHYIACQGPMPSTEVDFWRMCWSERVGAVVMLTNTTERGVNKCSPYYPTQPGARLLLRGSCGAARGGSGTNKSAAATPPQTACVEEVVSLSSKSSHSGDLTCTTLRLVGGGGGSGEDRGDGGEATNTSRDIEHLHYTAWPDHGTPADGAAIRTICDMVEAVRAAGRAVVVHCSAGIGRTGTFCAIDILRRRLGHLEALAASRPGSVRPDAVQEALDLPELVHNLRWQRYGMVQTIEQYAFCYQAVCEELLAALGSGGGGGRRRSGGADTPPRISRR
ncbi:hypothetical protein Vretimale_19080 [Volvox reticuliferus]|uniref:Protein tyrosine phosphatase n=1 Tax=Volvox reticuliferus TaxID=1737510 RepID=A0A8J4GYN0_9CHLO|nr:hypothetical protein Vretimale_19080 [Volvox reticuliferus]